MALVRVADAAQFPGLMPNTFVFVNYGVREEPWHERLLLSRVDADRWVILTPDDDRYVEDLAAMQDVKPGRAEGRHVLPHGLGAAAGAPVYRFTGTPSREVRARECALADAEAAAERLVLVGAGGGVAPEVVGGELEAVVARPRWRIRGKTDPAALGGAAPLAVGEGEDGGGRRARRMLDPIDEERTPRNTYPSSLEVPPGFVWVVSGLDSAIDFGSVVLPSDGDWLSPHSRCGVHFVSGTGIPVELVPDGHAASFISDKLAQFEEFTDGSGDVRTLPVKFEASGEKYRLFSEAVGLMVEEPFAESDFPVAPPRSANWWLQAVRRSGTSPVARHNKWIGESGVSLGDRSVYEHEILSETVEMLVCYDQLQVCNLAGCELLIRRIQLIEEAHVLSPGAPCYDGSEHWLGTGRRKGGVLISPSLAKVVADKVRDEHSVAKERRKAREERRLAPNSGGPKNQVKAKGKAGGKGAGDEEP